MRNKTKIICAQTGRKFVIPTHLEHAVRNKGEQEILNCFGPFREERLEKTDYYQEPGKQLQKSRNQGKRF